MNKFLNAHEDNFKNRKNPLCAQIEYKCFTEL